MYRSVVSFSWARVIWRVWNSIFFFFLFGFIFLYIYRLDHIIRSYNTLFWLNWLLEFFSFILCDINISVISSSQNYAVLCGHGSFFFFNIVLGSMMFGWQDWEGWVFCLIPVVCIRAEPIWKCLCMVANLNVKRICLENLF